MTAAELSEKYTGRTAQVRSAEGFTVECVVQDVRQAYGRIDVLVAPVSGGEESWVSVTRTDLDAVLT